MLDYFFKYEIQKHKTRIFEDCKINGCYADISLIETICMMHTTTKLNTYNYVQQNIFIHPCMKKIIFDIFCTAIRNKNRVSSICIRYIRKRRASYVSTDLSLNPLSETNPMLLIDIMHDYKKYTFKLFDLANIIVNSLTNGDDHYFPNPLMIKNPYTNIKFSIENLYIIYFCMQNRGLFIHPLFSLFMKENFNLEQFSFKHEGLIKEYVIDRTIQKYTCTKACHELRNMFHELTIYNLITLLFEPIIPGINLISSDLLITFKPLLYHYYHSLYSINSYYKQIEYNKLIKKLIAFKNENPFFTINYKIVVPITKVNYKHVTIPRRAASNWESLLLIA